MIGKVMEYILILFVLSSLLSCTALSKEEKEKFKEAILKDDREYIHYILSKGVDLNDKDFIKFQW